MKKYFIIIIIFLSCDSKKSTTDSVRLYYDSEVLYNFQGKDVYLNDKYRSRFSPNTLYVFVESNFSDDLLEIRKDEKLVVKDTVNTEKSSGIAEEYKFKDIANINNLLVRLNGSPWIYVETSKKEYNLIGIRKKSEKIQIVFYKEVPVFD